MNTMIPECSSNHLKGIELLLIYVIFYFLILFIVLWLTAFLYITLCYLFHFKLLVLRYE